MTIHEAEEKYGCKWDQFTPSQRQEVVKSIKVVEELTTPLITIWAMSNFDFACKTLQDGILRGVRERLIEENGVDPDPEALRKHLIGIARQSRVGDVR